MQKIKFNARLPLLLTLLFAALIVFFLKQPKYENSTTEIDEQDQSADYYMKDYTLIANDNTGIAQHWFSGYSLRYYPSAITFIESPKFTVNNEDRIWVASAKQGQIIGENELTLFDEVKIAQVNANYEQVAIQTDQISISMQDKILTSDNKVTVKSDNSQLTATGMRIDFAKQKIKFLSQVKASYVNP